MRIATYLLVVTAVVAVPVQAATVEVEINCTVAYSQVNFGELADVRSGDSAIWKFQLDSENYQDSALYPTRGYVIDSASFSLDIGSASIGIQGDWTGTPYFVVRNNDPVADGFVLSDNTDWPGDVPSDEPGMLGQFAHHFEVGYSGTGSGNILDSLDILDAVGTYAYDGLTSYYIAVMDGWAEPIGLDFNHITITPEPGTLCLAGLLGVAALKRRR